MVGRLIRTRPTVLVLVACLVAAPALGAFPVGATASSDTSVDSCRTIDSSGDYELTEDLKNRGEDVCIEITADDVTFDGDGHLIAGQSRTGTVGIRVKGAEGVTITDVHVSEWAIGIDVDFGSSGTRNVDIVDNHVTDNVRAGIFGEDVGATSIRHNHVKSNAVGIEFRASSSLEVDDNAVEDNDGRGIFLDDTSDRGIEDNEVVDNGGRGIYVLDLGADVVGNVVSENGESGIVVDAENNDASGHDVSDNEVSENCENGIVVRNIENVHVDDNDVYDNEGDGILLVDFRDGEATGNEAWENDDDGLHVLEASTVFDGSRNVIEDNVFEDNDDDGLFVEFSSDNTVEDNEMIHNGDDGVQFSGTEDNDVEDNEVRKNHDDGMRLVDANSNTIEKNAIEKNDDDGLDLDDADDNDVVKNRICGNGDSQIVDDDASTGTTYVDNDVSRRC